MPPQAGIRSRAAIRHAEDLLGVPADLLAANDFYAARREEWYAWMLNVTDHAWRFADETPCLICGQVTTVMKADNTTQTVCIECLQTPVPWWPTGWVMAQGLVYVHHSQNCTSHSSYPTSLLTTLLESPSTYLEMPSMPTSGPTSTSSSNPQAPQRSKSLPPMRLSR